MIRIASLDRRWVKGQGQGQEMGWDYRFETIAMGNRNHSVSLDRHGNFKPPNLSTIYKILRYLRIVDPLVKASSSLLVR